MECRSKVWKRHSPVLFPNVGKTWHNVVKIQGEQYPTSQHGFARDHDFKCIHAGKEEVKFLLTSTDEMKEVYPFDFELYISYRLKKNVIEVEWEIKTSRKKRFTLPLVGIRPFTLQKKMKPRQITGFISRKKII
mgnify:CR=1 FL=1